MKEMGWWACLRDDRSNEVKSAAPAPPKGQPEAGVGIFSDQEHKTQDGQERTLSVRQQQEIQEVLRRMNDFHYVYPTCQHFPEVLFERLSLNTLKGYDEGERRSGHAIQLTTRP